MNKYIIVALSIIFSGCSSDIEVDLPKPKNKISVAGFLNPDSVFLHFSQNTYILDHENWGNVVDIQNISINLKENENEIPNLERKFLNRGIFRSVYYFTSIKKPEEGKTYTLTVSAPGYPTINSQTYIPYSVPFTLESRVSNQYTNSMEFIVTFNDPADKVNYYMVEFWDLSQIDDLYPLKRIECHDPIVEEALSTTSWGQPIFSDKAINGKTYSIRFFVHNLGIFTPKYKIRFVSLSEDLYKYFLSMEQWSKTYYDGFGEPVILYQNIMNGIGIFGGYSYKEIEFENPFYVE